MKLTTTLYLCALTTALVSTVSASHQSAGSGSPAQDPRVGTVTLDNLIIEADPDLPLGFNPRTAPKLTKQSAAAYAATQPNQREGVMNYMAHELPEAAFEHHVLYQFHQEVIRARNSMIAEVNDKHPTLVSESFKFKDAYFFQFRPKCNPWKKRVEAMTAVMTHYMKLLNAENNVYFARLRKGTNAQSILIAYEKAKYMRILFKLVVTRKGDVVGQGLAGDATAHYPVNNVASGLKDKLTSDLQAIAHALQNTLHELRPQLLKLLKSVKAKEDQVKFYQYGKFQLAVAAKKVADFELLMDREMENLLALNNNPDALSRRYCTQRALTSNWDAIKYLGRSKTAKISYPKAGLGMQPVAVSATNSQSSQSETKSVPFYTRWRQNLADVKVRMPTAPWNRAPKKQQDGSGTFQPDGSGTF